MRAREVQQAVQRGRTSGAVERLAKPGNAWQALYCGSAAGTTGRAKTSSMATAPEATVLAAAVVAARVAAPVLVAHPASVSTLPRFSSKRATNVGILKEKKGQKESQTSDKKYIQL